MYPQLQHAILACWIRHLGDPATCAQYRYQPYTFPMIRGPPLCEAAGLTDRAVGYIGSNPPPPPVPDTTVGLHWMEHDPSHAQLREFGQGLRRAGLRWCLLLTGDPHPAPHRWPVGQPRLRGILLDATHFGEPDAPLSSEAVQPGWYACLAPHLCFAMHGQGGDGQPLPAALLPPLARLGLHLWRRSERPAYALDTNQQPDVWEHALVQSEEVPMNGFPLMITDGPSTTARGVACNPNDPS